MNSFPEPQRVPVPKGEWFRIIPSQYPPIQVFEDIYESAEEFALAAAIEGMTNPRLQQEMGNLRRVPKEAWRSGPGMSVVMAPFIYLHDEARFSDATYGAYYAAGSIETAIEESAYHRARFLSCTNQPNQRVTMRVYSGSITGDVVSIEASPFAFLLRPTSTYRESQEFARAQRELGVDGILYSSVRDEGGRCIAVFCPSCVHAPKQRMHLEYIYDAREQRIRDVLDISRRDRNESH